MAVLVEVGVADLDPLFEGLGGGEGIFEIVSLD